MTRLFVKYSKTSLPKAFDPEEFGANYPAGQMFTGRFKKTIKFGGIEASFIHFTDVIRQEDGNYQFALGS
jgi:hypothetical protein